MKGEIVFHANDVVVGSDKIRCRVVASLLDDGSVFSATAEYAAKKDALGDTVWLPLLPEHEGAVWRRCAQFFITRAEALALYDKGK